MMARLSYRSDHLPGVRADEEGGRQLDKRAQQQRSLPLPQQITRLIAPGSPRWLDPPAESNHLIEASRPRSACPSIAEFRLPRRPADVASEQARRGMEAAREGLHAATRLPHNSNRTRSGRQAAATRTPTQAGRNRHHSAAAARRSFARTKGTPLQPRFINRFLQLHHCPTRRRRAPPAPLLSCQTFARVPRELARLPVTWPLHDRDVPGFHS